MNNNFQNPLEVLKVKSQESWSGCIEIVEPKDPSVSWYIYLLQGKIQYVTTTTGQQTRLNYLCQRYTSCLNSPVLDLNSNISEYSQLSQWLSNQQLENSEVKKILVLFALEGLIQVLSIEATRIEFRPAKRIKRALVSFEFGKYYVQIKDQIESWQEVRTYLWSCLSRLYLDKQNSLKFHQIWQELYTTPELLPLSKTQQLSSFVSLFITKSNIYQIATKTQLEPYFLATNLKYTIQEKIIKLLPCAERQIKQLNQLNQQNLSSTTINTNSSALIVCIDDSPTIQEQLKLTLETAGYQFLGILDPTVAIKNLAPHQPKVIFLDINMPNINGYDLCSSLRNYQKYKETPIVMLTSRDGMIDRVRAKLVGATEYLTKPCEADKLIELTKVLEKSAVAT
ncbi:response regulator receiver protein [Chondrocystis sp. NIES-4102]|nr:response regulator receiver protein [Chondrocystis sp. NIES-4102]